MLGVRITLLRYAGEPTPPRRASVQRQLRTFRAGTCAGRAVFILKAVQTNSKVKSTWLVWATN